MAMKKELQSLAATCSAVVSGRCDFF